MNRHSYMSTIFSLSLSLSHSVCIATAYISIIFSLPLSVSLSLTHTHTHTHTVYSMYCHCLHLHNLLSLSASLRRAWCMLQVKRSVSYQSLYWSLEEPLINGARLHLCGDTTLRLMQTLTKAKVVK